MKRIRKMVIVVLFTSISYLALVMAGAPVVAVEEQLLDGQGIVSFKSDDQPTPPVDPENPSIPVEPGGEVISTEGPLRLDFLPQFRFGAQIISTKDETYAVQAQLFKSDTPARANYVQVTDNRGTLAGWQLTVKQEYQFSNEQIVNGELKGAVLSLDRQWANSINGQKNQPDILKEAIKIDQMGASYPIAIAERGKGEGTWTIQFGTSGYVTGRENTLTPLLDVDGAVVTDPSVGNQPVYNNQAIKLFVPGKTIKAPVKYTTVLTWTIAELS